jgi:hypothetical protein
MTPAAAAAAAAAALKPNAFIKKTVLLHVTAVPAP